MNVKAGVLLVLLASAVPAPATGGDAETVCNGQQVALCRALAERGDADAQFYLGMIYADGRGVPQDYVQAHMWLELAAARGDAYAGPARDILAAAMTPEERAEAQRLAREWKPAQ